MKTFLNTILICIVLTKVTIAQTDEAFEQIIEAYLPATDEDLNYDEVYEMLYQYYQSPINLNSTDRAGLEQLNLLNNQQLNAFINYRKLYGPLLSIFELQAIPYFDLQTIYRLKPFVKVLNNSLNTDNRRLWTKIKEEKNSYFIIRTDRSIETKEGYRSNEEAPTYLGDPYRVYTKFRVEHTNDFSIGFTLEKDGGEKFSWKPSQKQYLFDYYSFHFQIKNKLFLKNIIIGDYQIQYGQSLVFGAGFSLGKGAHAIATARRSNMGLTPYGSVIEKNFLRGIATTVQVNKQLDLTCFYSFNKLDANIQTDSIEFRRDYIQSMNISGLHNTRLTLERKNNAHEQQMGGTLLFTSKAKQLNLGINYLYTLYELPIYPQETKYNQYRFSGKDHFITSLFANYYWKNTHLFSEFAYDKSGGIGLLSGLILTASNNLQISILGRHYQRNFYSPLGAALGEQSRNNNESGIYLGIRNTFSKKLVFTAFVDNYKFPWVKYLADAPSTGHELLSRLNYDFNKQTQAYFQFRLKVNQKNGLEDSSSTYNLINHQKQQILLNLTYQANTQLSFRSRIQYSDYSINSSKSDGIALIQDVTLNLRKLSINGRYALFDTDDYNNRQYVYEKDVLYAFSIPAYQDTGSRIYVLLKYQITKNIKFWAKWSQFRYFDKDEIGSGNEKIDGDTKSDVKFQILIKL